jgi:hypothetical protein
MSQIPDGVAGPCPNDRQLLPCHHLETEILR